MKRFLKGTLSILALAGALLASPATAQEALRTLRPASPLLQQAAGAYTTEVERPPLSAPAHTPGFSWSYASRHQAVWKGWSGLAEGLSPMRRSVQARHQEPPGGDGNETWQRRLALIQGAYYTATGIWPILHIQSFEKVTGPKQDRWLVKTVGALIAVLGGTLVVTGIQRAPSRDLAAVALGSAAALTAVDVIYVAQGRISRIYLLDAAAELALITGWVFALR